MRGAQLRLTAPITLVIALTRSRCSTRTLRLHDYIKERWLSSFGSIRYTSALQLAHPPAERSRPTHASFHQSSRCDRGMPPLTPITVGDAHRPFDASYTESSWPHPSRSTVRPSTGTFRKIACGRVPHTMMVAPKLIATWNYAWGMQELHNSLLSSLIGSICAISISPSAHPGPVRS